MSQKEKNHTINSRSWNVLVSHELEDFCIRANAWNATTVALPEVMDAKGGQHFDGGGFSCAVGAQETEQFPFVHGKGNALNGFDGILWFQ